MAVSRGQSLIEYSFCALLVIGVSISGLLFLQQNLSGSIVHMISKPQKNSTSALLNQPSQSYVTKQTNLEAHNIAKTQQMLKNTQDLVPTDYTANAVNTAGGNGDIQAMADYVESLVRQAIANGELSPEDADFDLRLANKGHEIANIQAILERARAQANGNLDQYQTMNLIFDGQSYSPVTLGNHLNTVISEYNNMRLLMMNESKGLSKTLTEAVVRDATLKIRKAAESTHNIAITNSKAMSIGAAEHKEGKQAGITYASETHQNSALVCVAGEHTDQNNQCIK